MRKTFTEMDEATVRESDGRLFFGSVEVALVYFRAGYGPGDYPSDAEWKIRQKIEMSYAIKVPTIAWQLAGAKKVRWEPSARRMLHYLTFLILLGPASTGSPARAGKIQQIKAHQRVVCRTLRAQLGLYCQGKG